MMSEKGKTYFASDFHLGSAMDKGSHVRERRVVSWLKAAAKDASAIYLLGDIFDFWFEYKRAVPKGHVRLLGALAEIVDSGVEVHVFTGNHDMWMFDYLPQEVGVKLHREPITVERGGKKFQIGHGDGLGPGDHGYKFIKAVFASKLCQWLYARLHPNFGVWLAQYFSRKSREATGNADDQYMGDDNEFLVQHCLETLKTEHFDYFIFGHRHLVIDMPIGEKSRYINLGAWFKGGQYAVFDGRQLELKTFVQGEE